jgi:hypothetical protein
VREIRARQGRRPTQVTALWLRFGPRGRSATEKSLARLDAAILGTGRVGGRKNGSPAPTPAGRAIGAEPSEALVSR